MNLKDSELAFPGSRLEPHPLSGQLSGQGLSYERCNYPGMTLRDWFAGQALQGFLAMCAGRHSVGDGPDGAAQYAYAHADAMLTERAR